MSIFASKNDAIVEDKPQSSPLRRALPKSDSDDDRDTVLMKPRKKSKRIIEDEEDEEKHPVPSMEVDIRNTTQSSVESVRKALAPANPLHDATAKAKIRERFLRRFDITNTTEDEDGVNAEDEREEVVLARMQAETKSRKSAKNIKYTPLEQQYLDIKKKHPDCLLVVEVGYKFRFFEEDALTASKDKNMYGASIPTQRLNVHAKKLVQLGYKVGIVRQTETAAIKGLRDSYVLI
ncbi:DNA mismatch repair protein MutS [Chytridium lagenaria]|nr:DNA mismatch repair protein MutS [Chytridium lagenaria]